ncbi:RIP metalloprotease RseP [Spiribacter sp. C176]|uniref:Zinc metalloprotease n=1 Tax=Spiribacter salilacus TaxID=2664894 RepID=A0A6N7QNF7_9GAMM|nr:RIP metalloprotease RseP [Spiribacter salilacus]MRH77210.1 RIP metalloprotease RseP [Spiribacter salilacus]
MGWLVNILGFLLVIGILVTVHEFGHFWVARKVGVKVLRFSVGFGQPLWRRIGQDGTEYVLAAIPFGGYVKMLDEREAAVDPALQSQAFNRQPLWARNAIISAGPIANFLLAVLAYWAIFVIGATEMKPIIGPVIPDSPAAAAGLEEGDELVRIGDRNVRAWDSAIMAFLENSADSSIVVTVNRSTGGTAERSLDLSQQRLLDDEGDVLRKIGLTPWQPTIVPIVREVIPGSAAAMAELEPGDRIIAIDGNALNDWSDLVEAVQARPNEEVVLRYAREGTEREVATTIQAREGGGAQSGVLGITPDVPADLFANAQHEVRYGPLAAVPRAIDAGWQAGSLTVSVLFKMVVGEASVKNLSGPVSIAQYAGDSVSLGVIPFLKFLAIVSISLGILNLLPVPILDGGHLLYNGIEWIRGRPLTEAAQVFGQQIGIVLLFILMALAFYNDILRLMVSGG